VQELRLFSAGEGKYFFYGMPFEKVVIGKPKGEFIA
jgi:hypothetical protein